MGSWKGYGTAADKILCVYIFNEKVLFMLLTLKMLILEKEVLDSLRGSAQVFHTCSVKCSFVPESLFVVHGMNSFTQRMLINTF